MNERTDGLMDECPYDIFLNKLIKHSTGYHVVLKQGNLLTRSTFEFTTQIDRDSERGPEIDERRANKKRFWRCVLGGGKFGS